MNDNRRSTVLKLLVARLSQRSSIGQDEARAILSLPAEVVSIKPQVEFVQGGDEVEHSCLVGEGLVARFEQLEDGRRQIIGFCIPGDLIDIYSLLLTEAPSTLQAISAAVIVKIPHAALRALIADWPKLAMAFWRDTIVDANVTAQTVVRLGRRDAYARVAHLLCEMAFRYREIGQFEKSGFRFPLTQEQLADAVGLTSVHVNRTLRALRADGLVTFASGRVEIQSWSGLSRAASFDPAYLCLSRSDTSSGRAA